MKSTRAYTFGRKWEVDGKKKNEENCRKMGNIKRVLSFTSNYRARQFYCHWKKLASFRFFHLDEAEIEKSKINNKKPKIARGDHVQFFHFLFEREKTFSLARSKLSPRDFLFCHVLMPSAEGKKWRSCDGEKCTKELEDSEHNKSTKISRRICVASFFLLFLSSRLL